MNNLFFFEYNGFSLQKKTSISPKKLAKMRPLSAISINKAHFDILHKKLCPIIAELLLWGSEVVLMKRVTQKILMYFQSSKRHIGQYTTASYYFVFIIWDFLQY